MFVLWRQDDNGNCFAVGSHADRAAAERQLAELSRFPHKQTYWIAEEGNRRELASPAEET